MLKPILKPMTNHRQLMSGYDKGHIDEVAKDLNRYQTIETDKEWVDPINQNSLRRKTFLVKHSQGVARWEVTMRNGNVQGVGVTFKAF